MVTRTGDGAWGTPSRAFARMGENAMAGPVRGYLKLSAAAEAFSSSFRGKTVLDIGSSTGGFTEYALNHGAKKVIAVEKGSHQMKAPLRFDPRIDLHEKTDIFNVSVQNNIAENHKTKVTLSCVPDIIVADVSFISLTKILKHVKNHLAGKHTEFLVMLKPQFEAAPFQLKNGVVKNETIRRTIIKNFEQWLKQNKFLIVKKHDNELHGKTGNIERFYYLILAK